MSSRTEQTHLPLFLPLFVFSCLPPLGSRSKSIPILADVLQPSICPPLPMDIYSAGFLDDSQDEALRGEHSLCLIWVSELSSPGRHKEGTKQIAFKAFNKSEYTFWQRNCFPLHCPNLTASRKNKAKERENKRKEKRERRVTQSELYSRSFVQGKRMKINENRVARPPKAAKLEIHFEGNLICCKWAKNILLRRA